MHILDYEEFILLVVNLERTILEMLLKLDQRKNNHRMFIHQFFGHSFGVILSAVWVI